MDTTTEIQNNKITQSIRIDPDVYAAIEQVRVEDDRPSMANAIDRLLRTHPRVKKLLEAEIVASAA